MSSNHIVEPWRPTSHMEPDTTYRHRRPVHDLVTPITPNADHFVLSHFGNARVDPADWRLHIDGLVERPAVLSLDDVRSFPRREVQSVLQCGGFPDNPRINTHNASNAVWAGADLAEVLDHVGVDPRASYVWSFGPDHGSYADWSADHYVKDLPMERVRRGVLLAYELGGEPLTPEHGFPLRLFVPGFYGTNSVKWLCRIVVADHRAPGLFSTELYNDLVEPASAAGTAQSTPVWEVAPDAIIVAPRQNERVPHTDVHVWGWTWADDEIAAVEVSLDNGASWGAAEVGGRIQHSWQRFDFHGSSPSLGKTTIVARATDVHGTTQPLEDARNSAHRVSAVLV